jgi:hypothetical protein
VVIAVVVVVVVAMSMVAALVTAAVIGPIALTCVAVRAIARPMHQGPPIKASAGDIEPAHGSRAAGEQAGDGARGRPHSVLHDVVLLGVSVASRKSIPYLAARRW